MRKKPSEFLLDLSSIDPRLRQLISDLNAAGHKTWSSCQGKQHCSDIHHGRHCDHSFITFDPHVLPPLKRKAKKLGLIVNNGDITLTPINGREQYWEELFEKNRSFPHLVRFLFGLPL